MARRLNKPLLVRLLIFLGIPLVVVAAVVFGPWGRGNPTPFYDEAMRCVTAGDWTKAWLAINDSLRAGGAQDPEIQYQAGVIAMHQTPPAWGRAIQAFRTAIALKKDNVDAQRELTLIYLSGRMWREAKLEINRLIEMDPSFGMAYVWGANIEMILANNEPLEAKRGPFYDAALARCQAGIEKAPDVLELYHLMAQAYEKLGQPEKVQEVLDLAIAKNPALPEAYVMKASRLVLRGKPEEADEVLDKALKAIGPNAKLYRALGSANLSLHNPDKARASFIKALELDPKNEEVYLRLGSMYRLDNLVEKAQAIFERGLKELPGSLTLMSELADLLTEMGDLAKADKLVEDISRAQPEAPVLSYLRGKRALRSMQVWQAIWHLELAQDKQPSPRTAMLLYRAYILADEWGLALRGLVQLTNQYPGMMDGQRLLADVEFKLRDLDKASVAARKVLTSNPDDTGMRLLVAQTLATQGKLPEALKEAREAARRDSNNPDPLLLVADILRNLKPPQNEEAEKTLLLAFDVSKKAPRIFQLLASFYTDTKQAKKLEDLMEEAKKVLPEGEFIVGPLSDYKLELERRVTAGTATTGNLIMLARLCQVADQTKEAKEYLRQVLKKAPPGSPDWRVSWQQLFLLEVAEEAFGNAAQLIAELRTADPSAVELLFAEPVLAMSQGKLADAASQLRDLTQSPRGRSLSQAFYMLGIVLVRQSKLDEAAAEFQKALDLRPQLLPARITLGRIYLQQGNLDGALAAANEALKFAQQLVPALEMRAVAAAGLARWDDAVAAREEIARIVPNNVRNLVLLASLYAQRGQPEKAEEVYNRGFKLVPDNDMLTASMADFYAGTNRPALGEKLINDYVTRHEKDFRAWIIRGNFTARTGSMTEADPQYRKAAALAQGDPVPLIVLASQYGRRGDWPHAISIYKEAIALKPDSLEARRSLADAYMLSEQLGEARKLIDAVLRDKPDDPFSLVVAGRIASREDKPEEAVRLIRQAMALDPGNGEAKVQLAELLAGPAPDEADALLRTIDPSDAAFERAMLQLSDIDTRRAQLDIAILHLRRLVDFQPSSLSGRQALVYRYMANHQPDKAVIEIRELLKMRGQDAGLLVELGDALSAQNRFDDALDAYEKALGIKPDASAALFGQTRCLVALKRGPEALLRIGATMNKYPDALWPRLSLAFVYESAAEEAERPGAPPDPNDNRNKAFEAIRTGVAQHENWEEGYVLLANMKTRYKLMDPAKRIEEARQILKGGIEKVKDSIPIRTALANLELTMQRPEAARQALEPLAAAFDKLYGTGTERLSKLRPYMLPIRSYSLAWYRLKNPAEAVKWGMKLYALDPTDVTNTNNMAWILANDFHDLARAGDMIRRCLRLVPRNPQLLDTAGWIAFLANNYPEAAVSLEASIKAGETADARYHRGRLFEEMQRPQDASAEYKRAIDMGGLSPEDKQDAEARFGRLKG
jgi:tetratricopeptide (TPR) repeat protein